MLAHTIFSLAFHHSWNFSGMLLAFTLLQWKAEKMMNTSHVDLKYLLNEEPGGSLCAFECVLQFFLLWPICLYSICNNVTAIKCTIFHSPDEIKLLHLQPWLVQWFRLLLCREVHAMCWCVQFCKIMAWTCRVGLVPPQGWISTPTHTHTHTRTLNEVRIKQQQHSLLQTVPQGVEVSD